MFDAKRLLDQFLGGMPGNAGQPGDPGRQGGGILDTMQGYARSNPMLTGGLAGGLAGILLGRGVGKDLIKYGGMAVIGGLAYKAYRDWQQGQAGATAPAGDAAVLPPPADSPFAVPASAGGQAKLAEALVAAMIAAAKADGHIDAEERGRIYERLEAGGLQPEEIAFLQAEIAKPVDMERIAWGASSKEEAVEIYAASVMAIRADTPAERDWLDKLAHRLGLAPDLAASIEKTIAGATGAAAG